MAARKKGTTKKRAAGGEKKTPVSYTVNVFGARPHRVDPPGTPSFTGTFTSSRKAERTMKDEAVKLGLVGAYGEIRLASGKIYRQGAIQLVGSEQKFVNDGEI